MKRVLFILLFASPVLSMNEAGSARSIVNNETEAYFQDHDDAHRSASLCVQWGSRDVSPPGTPNSLSDTENTSSDDDTPLELSGCLDISAIDDESFASTFFATSYHLETVRKALQDERTPEKMSAILKDFNKQQLKAIEQHALSYQPREIDNTILQAIQKQLR